MTNYKARFDEQTNAAVQALNGKRDDFRNNFYGFEPAYVRRLLERISASLQKLDEGKINHPVFLAGKGQSFPDKAIQLIGSIPSAINDSGITHFINSVLPDLVLVDEGLSKAVGINEIRAAEIKSSQLRSIEKYTDWSKNAYTQIVASKSSTEAAGKEAKASKETIANLAQEADVDAKKIKEIRTIATRLSSGTKTSPALSTLIKDAQAKLSELDEDGENAKKILAAIETKEKSISALEQSANEAMSRLAEQDVKAKDILNNATQAGLAGAYKLEREKLAKQQFYFACAFYGIIALVVIYAAVFIVPIASEIILNHKNQAVTISESGLLLFVRILIVLPAFWALIFTNKRFVYLETLQMDYAAKAVTALAYSGYRDEMNDDSNLSTRLRDGLVTRFVEHPSRLLGEKVESSISITDREGSKVVTESHSPEAEPIRYFDRDGEKGEE